MDKKLVFEEPEITFIKLGDDIICTSSYEIEDGGEEGDGE